MTKTVVVVSDIHVGHKLAVMPETFTTHDGTVIKANVPQRALFKAWQKVASEWGNPDILVINGEPIDGQQPKDRGVEAWTTNYLDQIEASVKLIDMFGAEKTYVTRGSNYHVNLDGISIEELFGERIGAEKVNRGFVSPELFLDVGGIVFNFAHHIAGSVSGWMYRSTPPAKEMMLMQLNTSHKWPFDVLVRSHNHYYWAVESSSKLALLTPSWQLQTWFNYRKSSAGTIPDIGAVRFLVDGGEHRHEKMLFQLEESRPLKVKA